MQKCSYTHTHTHINLRIYVPYISMHLMSSFSLNAYACKKRSYIQYQSEHCFNADSMHSNTPYQHTSFDAWACKSVPTHISINAFSILTKNPIPFILYKDVFDENQDWSFLSYSSLRHLISSSTNLTWKMFFHII